MVPCRKLYMPTYLGVLSITRGSGKFIIVGSKRQLLESERRPQRMGLGVAGCAAPSAAHPVTTHRLGCGDAAGPRLLLVVNLLLLLHLTMAHNREIHGSNGEFFVSTHPGAGGWLHLQRR